MTYNYLNVQRRVEFYFPVQKFCKEANYINERKIESRVIALGRVHTSTIAVVRREGGRRRVVSRVRSNSAEHSHFRGVDFNSDHALIVTIDSNVH